ncbi:hypothetical protein [Paenibacillus xylanilyticus]|uniref:Uncharacterized protein n=1 Tax=Paenibacillus xylanilyticus TaxID=248903 RepID=A0A7Y6BTS6_9BACL|nr:hypothetical protein [Paenibacillus xylanilyticus]NUU74792.1 hypothetical protein [Paenibacillus xylanilyticus]
MDKGEAHNSQDEKRINSIIDVVVSDATGEEYKCFVELINSGKPIDELAFDLENLYLEQTRKAVIHAYKMGAADASHNT